MTKQEQKRGAPVHIARSRLGGEYSLHPRGLAGDYIVVGGDGTEYHTARLEEGMSTIRQAAACAQCALYKKGACHAMPCLKGEGKTLKLTIGLEYDHIYVRAETPQTTSEGPSNV